jgi:twitching motility protein PilT
MLRHRSEQQAGHILTLEDPIEFVHASRRSLVHQREVGQHVPGFADGLRSALREDPDCILVGELRDLDTVRLALTAAETGHLVLVTLHSASAAKAVDRLVDVFPGDEKPLVRTMLSESLQAAVYQTLCPVLDEAGGVQGRIAAHEILLGTPAVRNLIREGKSAQIVSVMQTSQAQGMQTLEQSIAALSRRVRLAPDLLR